MKYIKSQKAKDLLLEYDQDEHCHGVYLDNIMFVNKYGDTPKHFDSVTEQEQDQIADDTLAEIKSVLAKTHYEVWEKRSIYIGDKRKKYDSENDYTKWSKWYVTDNKQEAIADAKANDIPCRVIETKIILDTNS
jgi:hypothetical protein